MNDLEKRKLKFLEDAKIIHGNTYDYSEVEYLNVDSKVKIRCPLHGGFFQTPYKHSKEGNGCPQCSLSAKVSYEEFVKRSNLVHKNFYDYSLCSKTYNGVIKKVNIICKTHGAFLQQPYSHLSGAGCPKCKNKNVTTEEFITKAISIHGNTYDYSLTNYVNNLTEIKIICKEHGEFLQKPSVHLTGCGCKKCSFKKISNKFSDSKETFIEKSKIIHGDTYDYSEVQYSSSAVPVEIICKKHGSFWPRPGDHINQKTGCPNCSHTISRPQIEVEDYIKSLGVDTIRDYKLENNTEIDVFCPKYSIGFEYNGLRFHGEFFKDKNYHIEKTIQAENQNIHLIHIWEDEWLYQRSKIENLIRVRLGLVTEKSSARSCIISKLSWATASKFLDKNHLQSACAPTSFSYGLFNNNELMAVMCFTTSTVLKSKNEIELIRFCSKGIVRGAFNKLLKYFINSEENTFSTLVSFSDKRFSKGNIYLRSGFEKVNSSTPTYWWCKGNVRFHRRGFQHKYLKEKFKAYDPTKTEVENCHDNNYFRIWDCGKDKWILKIR